MARDSLPNAKAELVGVLAPGGVPAAPSVGRVQDFDPVVQYPAAGKAAVTVATSGIGPTEWAATVRVYAKADADPRAASLLLDQAAQEVSVVMEGSYGRVSWRLDYDPAIASYVALCEVPLPREDF